MKIVKGNKLIELNSYEFGEVVGNFSKFVIDLGTGDGRLVYEKSIEDPKALYIGIDPSQKQLQTYSKKAQKDKRYNALFILGSIEVFPPEIQELADQFYIILPWGSLLEAIVRPTQKTVLLINKIMRDKGILEIILGYAHDSEPSETKRLNLPKINVEYIKETVLPIFSRTGFTLMELKQLQKNELKTLKTTWGKKLTFGKERPIFRIVMRKN